jgi:hypothetical protein
MAAATWLREQDVRTAAIISAAGAAEAGDHLRYSCVPLSSAELLPSASNLPSQMAPPSESQPLLPVVQL